MNLAEGAPNVADLQLDPPAIRLPPDASFSRSEYFNADPSYQRSTLNTIPTSSALLSKSKLPLALVITPYRSVHDSDHPVPVISDNVIARCRRCRSYINPFVVFIEGGGRWRCNLCSLSNDVPHGFDWDADKRVPADRFARGELMEATCEYIAPPEYMVRRVFRVSKWPELIG